MLPPTAARRPTRRAGGGHYESYYLRAVDPGEPRGVWIRYTVTVPPDSCPAGQLWFTYFTRPGPPRAVRRDCGEPPSGDATGIRLGEATFTDSAAGGAATSELRSARWNLRWRSAEEPLLHLHGDWMYTTRLPRTKLLSLHPKGGVRRHPRGGRRDARHPWLAGDDRALPRRPPGPDRRAAPPGLGAGRGRPLLDAHPRVRGAAGRVGVGAPEGQVEFTAEGRAAYELGRPA